MAEVLMVIAPEMFRDEEYAEPRRVLEAAGHTVSTASVRAGRCTGRFGMVVEADLSLGEALKRAPDAVVFVGGPGASVFFDDPLSHRLAHETHERGGVVSAICIAPSTLARAGSLDGVRATAFPSQKSDLVAHGAVWDDGPVVTDGRIVTANGPEAAQVFGESVAALLCRQTNT